MKNGPRKMAALISILVLCLGIISGCAANKSPDTQTGANTAASTVANKTVSTSAAADTKNTLPVVKQPLTLTYWATLSPKVSASLKSNDEMLSYQELAKRTGVTFKFIHPPIGQEQDVFNLMVASGDYPDIVEYNFNPYPTLVTVYPGGPEKALQDKFIIPMNDLIDKYAPNYKAFLKGNKEFAKQVTTDSGKLYGFTESFPDEKPGVPNRGLVVTGFQIRKDWLDKIGMPLPTNIDDWYTVLSAFKAKNPNGKGDVIPFLPKKTTDIYGITGFIGSFGIEYGYYVVDGKVKYGPVEPEYKEFLTAMSKWYKEGLIDPNFPLNDSKASEAKILSDRAGSYVGLLMGGMGKYIQTKENEGKQFGIAGVEFPKDKKTGKSFDFIRKDVSGTCVAITTKNKHPVETTKVLDYIYSDEGCLLMNFGVEGVTFTMVNGSPKYTEIITKNPAKLEINSAISHYCRGGINCAGFKNDPLTYQQRMLYPVQDEAFKLWSKATAERKLPPVTPIGDETQRMAAIMTQVQTYCDEMLLKFIMGQEPLDKFDSYVENVKKMGIADAVKINQAALDRYNAR